MSPRDSQTASPQAAKPQAFKSQYKLQGIVASVTLMWLDFAIIHHGLVANDPAVVGAGMIIMVGAVAIGYFFG